MKKWLFIFLFLPILTFAKDNHFNKIVIFGDSLSDTGNLWRNLAHILPKSPPYYHGHFSNGKMWDEVLYEHFFPNRNDFADYNYAVGGASAYFSWHSPLPYTLSDEVSDYLFHYDNDDNTKVLYVIWIGGNNYLRQPSYSSSVVKNVVAAIKKQSKRLLSEKANKLLIMNLPNMGRMPDALEGHEVDLFTHYSKEHNERLAKMITELREEYPLATIASFDAEQKLDEVFNNPEKFHMHHLTTACFTGGYTFNPQDNDLKSYLASRVANSTHQLGQMDMDVMLQDKSLKETLKVALYQETHGMKDINCDDYLFWDHIHPSTHAHYYIAQYVIDAIKQAGLVADK